MHGATIKVSQNLFTPVNKVKTLYVDKSPGFIHKKKNQREFRRHLRHTRQKLDRVHAEPKSRTN